MELLLKGNLGFGPLVGPPDEGDNQDQSLHEEGPVQGHIGTSLVSPLTVEDPPSIFDGVLGEDPGVDTMAPSMPSLVGFKWHFLSGMWALIPASVLTPFMVVNEDSSLKEGQGVDTTLAGHTAEDFSIDKFSKSDDSMSEFERNLWELMPDLPWGPH